MDGWLLLHVSCYCIGLDKVDWYMARDHCKTMSSHLAVITSEAEQNAVVQEFNASVPEPIWLGGMYDLQQNVWRWSNNETWSFNANRRLCITHLVIGRLCITHLVIGRLCITHLVIGCLDTVN